MLRHTRIAMTINHFLIQSLKCLCTAPEQSQQCRRLGKIRKKFQEELTALKDLSFLVDDAKARDGVSIIDNLMAQF